MYKISQELKTYSSNSKAEFFPRFFKTAKGEYGYGDKFLGITVPDCRKVAKKYINEEVKEVIQLLHSEWHEERLTALLILVLQFNKAKDDINQQAKIFNLYLENTKYINNWDLVDLSCSYIVGKYLLKKDKSILYKLANSTDLWEKRISIVSTFEFIRNKEYADTFKIAEILLNDKHDLIHKAVGWMLREVGKRCGSDVLESFLLKYYKQMPRTMLRYSIEHFDLSKKAFYMAK